MSEYLAEGKEFKSFSALQDAVHKYEQTCFAQLSRTDSRTIENEEHRRNSKHFNPAIKYSFVTFTCAFGGKPYISRSTGIRNSKPRIKCNCPVVLKCFATTDGQRLVVRHSQLDCHNHDTSEESFKALPRGRLLDEETELEIFNLIEMHENKKLARKLVKEKLVEETGRDISYKDIQNIEKRMSRKREKERNGEEYDENEEIDDEEEERGSEQEEENEAVNEKGDKEEEDKGENGMARDNGDEGSAGEDGKKRSPARSPVKAKSKPPQSASKKKKATTPARKVKEGPSSRPSTGRPRREIREPRRFREIVKDLSPVAKKRRTSESEDEEEEEGGEDSADSQEMTSAKKQATPPKSKKPAAKRGRKPLRRTPQETRHSDQGASEEEEEEEEEAQPVKKEDKGGNSNSAKSDGRSDRMLEIEERRLQMQEQMLELQRQSILLLQNVVTKLDRVEENQKEVKVEQVDKSPPVGEQLEEEAGGEKGEETSTADGASEGNKEEVAAT